MRNSVVSTLITVSPMSQIENTDCNENEATKFNAEVHIHHFRTVFNFFELDLDDWLICQVADDTADKRKILEILRKPHIGCLNHKLALDVKCMLRTDSEMELTLKKIHDVMRTCKTKLKHRATLRNLTDLSPITPNETRWTARYDMVKRFNTTRDKLIEVAIVI